MPLQSTQLTAQVHISSTFINLLRLAQDTKMPSETYKRPVHAYRLDPTRTRLVTRSRYGQAARLWKVVASSFVGIGLVVVSSRADSSLGGFCSYAVGIVAGTEGEKWWCILER